MVIIGERLYKWVVKVGPTASTARPAQDKRGNSIGVRRYSLKCTERGDWCLVLVSRARLSYNESGNVSFSESPLKGIVRSNSYFGLVQVGPGISWTDNFAQSGSRCCYANCLL